MSFAHRKNEYNNKYLSKERTIVYCSPFFIFENKVAVVTGGGSGIGRGIAKRYANEGAKVIIAGRRENILKEVADSNKNISYVVADITNSDDVAKIVKIVEADFNGQLDILVNNAGWAPVTLLKELRMVDYDRAFALDVRAIGINNFDNEPEIFEDIMENAEIQPQALEIKMHPFAQRLEIRTLAEENDIQVLGGSVVSTWTRRP